MIWQEYDEEIEGCDDDPVSSSNDMAKVMVN